MNSNHSSGAPPHAGFPLPAAMPARVPVAPRIKELTERDRRSVLLHFLALDDEGRQMRFGTLLPDDLVTAYVQKLNFSRDAMFGVYDDDLQLVGVGHLVYMPCGALPGSEGLTDKARLAELGVSVLPHVRGRGIGTRLFERAVVHCRNDDIDTLYVHCLTANQIMMHIAIKAGMEIQRDHGEADAYLKLPAATAGSVLQEAVDEQVASLDYTFKANAWAFSRLFKGLAGIEPE